MTEQEYGRFFELLEKLVNEEKPVVEKASLLKAAGTESDVTNIFEFAAWWDVDDENGDEDPDEGEED